MRMRNRNPFVIPFPALMPRNQEQESGEQQKYALVRAAHFPGLRALAWSGDQLYASRGYQLVCAKIQDVSQGVIWQPAATFRPSWQRRLSVMNRLTARLFRDGFHALAVLPSGGLVAAVAGAIVTLRPNESEFRVTHTITRGTRPLHITTVPGGAVYWGEYFDNPSRAEVHVYASSDGGATWQVAFTFPPGAIRHIHNIVHDPWQNCLWVLTGDYGDECRILRASCDFSRVDTVLQGNQQARAVALVALEDGLYFSSDTPLESNYIYRLDRQGTLSRLAPISSSSIYGCRVGTRVFFSTMVEPSEVNRDRHVRVYGGNADTSRSSLGENEAGLRKREREDVAGSGEKSWQPVLAWKKDRWPIRFFQYGNAFLPDGNNSTPYLAVTTVAVESDDMTTSLFELSH
jgi:hypothetical protein